MLTSGVQVRRGKYAWVWYHSGKELTTSSKSPLLYANGAISADIFFRGACAQTDCESWFDHHVHSYGTARGISNCKHERSACARMGMCRSCPQLARCSWSAAGLQLVCSWCVAGLQLVWPDCPPAAGCLPARRTRCLSVWYVACLPGCLVA